MAKCMCCNSDFEEFELSNGKCKACIEKETAEREDLFYVLERARIQADAFNKERDKSRQNAPQRPDPELF